MKKKTLSGFVVFAAMLGLAACSGGSGSAVTEAQISTLDALPSATDAVQAGGAANSSLVRSLAKLGSSAGGYMALGEITSRDFSQSSSKAACEMFNMTKTAINQAAQGDLIQCYVTSTFEAALAAGASGIDIYDGNSHVFALSFPEGEDDGGPSKVKLRVVKNAAGYISTFEMLACGDNGESGDTQTMYLNQTIDGADFSMTSINVFSNQWGRGTDKSTVSGKLDASGNFVDSVDGAATPKAIHMQHSFLNVDDNFWGDLLFSQYSDHGTLVGTMNGSNSYNDVDCTFQDLAYGAVGLVDGNADGAQYDIGLLEMGDGAVNVAFAGGCDAESWSESFVEAWDGRTAVALADASASAYYGDVVGQSLTAASEPSIGFAAGQTWDCSDSAEYVIDFAALAASGINPMTQCSRLELGHQYIDCWNIVENGQETAACTASAACGDGSFCYFGRCKTLQEKGFNVSSQCTQGADCGSEETYSCLSVDAACSEYHCALNGSLFSGEEYPGDEASCAAAGYAWVQGACLTSEMNACLGEVSPCSRDVLCSMDLLQVENAVTACNDCFAEDGSQLENSATCLENTVCTVENYGEMVAACLESVPTACM